MNGMALLESWFSAATSDFIEQHKSEIGFFQKVQSEHVAKGNAERQVGKDSSYATSMLHRGMDFNNHLNPIGPDCGDRQMLNQTCFPVPNSGPGNFGTLQEITPNGLPGVLQLSARFSF
jgi:hypothetical protein